VFWGFKLLTGKDGMGYGDFKLYGAIGAWMGWQMLPLVLLLAAFAGAGDRHRPDHAARGRDRSAPIPFGPYLAGCSLDRVDVGPAARRRLPRVLRLRPLKRGVHSYRVLQSRG
jgi:leader peptidase (prepilin peptidase)/N-methyltransferase